MRSSGRAVVGWATVLGMGRRPRSAHGLQSLHVRALRAPRAEGMRGCVRDAGGGAQRRPPRAHPPPLSLGDSATAGSTSPTWRGADGSSLSGSTGAACGARWRAHEAGMEPRDSVLPARCGTP